MNENSRSQTKVIEVLKQMLSERDALIEKLCKENAALKGVKQFSAKDRFGSKTQKLSSRNRDSDSCESDKENFGGRSTSDLPSEDNVMALPSFCSEKQKSPYRKRMSYKRMKADVRVP